MPTFTYSARTTAGDLQTGEVEVRSRDEVVGYLRRRRLIPVKIQQKKSGIEIRFGTGIKARDIVVFTRQFATMINAGLPLARSLDVLAKQGGNKALCKVVEQVLDDVASGNTLADSLGKHPKVFTDLYTNTVAAGEAGGMLDTVLLRLATFLEKNDTLARKIKGAMVYPAVIVAVAIAAVTILLVFVIPTFENMFASAGVPLPLPTRIVIGLSGFLQSYWWAAGVGLVALLFLLHSMYKTDRGQLALGRLLLRIPILGDLLRKTAVARFTRMLSTLVASGVAILDGLDMTARTAGNRVIQDAILASRASIAGGETISEPLRESGVFPPMVVQMISVGEQTGGLDEMLGKIADFYDEEVDAAVETLLSAMEPVMVVVLGAVVGGMIVSMYLPIFDMVNAVQG